ncbi:hypothetical protein MHU86_17589 [Fragilaria crotonensis]|nr:hypothetical protein MHU86_17589 [Fragilaria crotonensis]
MSTNIASTVVDEILNDPSQGSQLGIDSNSKALKKSKKKKDKKKHNDSEKKVKKAKKHKSAANDPRVVPSVLRTLLPMSPKLHSCLRTPKLQRLSKFLDQQ